LQPIDVLLEALLFASPEPLTRDRLAELAQAPLGDVEAALGRLASALADRGVRLLRAGDSLRLATAPEVAEAIGRMLGAEARSRLSTAALEALAIIAYRQPITRTGVEAVRGVNSERAIATLQSRGLVTEIGRSEAPGRAILLGTTLEFLEYFGLADVADLPPNADAVSVRPERLRS
jgi:segregation and condensation protein B